MSGARREFAHATSDSAVWNCFRGFKATVGHRGARRQLRCEQLEARQMMSASGGELPSPEDADVGTAAIAQTAIGVAEQTALAAREQALAISAVRLRIGNSTVTVTSLEDPVLVNVGDSLQVVGVDYRLHGEESVSGKIAFEGYLNKIKGNKIKTGNVITGRSVQSGELPHGTSSHPGLKASWEMKAGTESITLVMVRYANNEAIVEDRIKIRTQVGTPDFVIDPDIRVRAGNDGPVVGRKVKIVGGWGNVGDGKYKNYAEVDIYHESDPTQLVWVGSNSGVVAGGDFDFGEFTQRHREKGFSKRWIPQLGGQYVLRFYVDPEDRWDEVDENNNVKTVIVDVRDTRAADPRFDAILGRGVRQHALPDKTPPAAAELIDAAMAAADDLETGPSGDSTPFEKQPEEAFGEASPDFRQSSVTPEAPSSAKTTPEVHRKPAVRLPLAADRWAEQVDLALDWRTL